MEHLDQCEQAIPKEEKTGSRPMAIWALAGVASFIVAQVAWTGFRAAENNYHATAQEVAKRSHTGHECLLGIKALSSDLPLFVRAYSDGEIAKICVRPSTKRPPEISGPQKIR